MVKRDCNTKDNQSKVSLPGRIHLLGPPGCEVATIPLLTMYNIYYAMKTKVVIQNAVWIFCENISDQAVCESQAKEKCEDLCCAARQYFIISSTKYEISNELTCAIFCCFLALSKLTKVRDVFGLGT